MSKFFLDMQYISPWTWIAPWHSVQSLVYINKHQAENCIYNNNDVLWGTSPSTIHKDNIAGYSMSSPRAQCLLYENGQVKSLVQRISKHSNYAKITNKIFCHSHFVCSLNLTFKLWNIFNALVISRLTFSLWNR